MTTLAEAQALVAAAVAARGYRANWTNEQFAARQVAKLQEELGELAAVFTGPFTVIDVAGRTMKDYFDFKGWTGCHCLDSDCAKAELADIAVVVLTLADALGYDVIQAAILKSQGDVERGIRQERGK